MSSNPNTFAGEASPASYTSPYIVELKGNSLDDGPGIRTVVFFKGCPLACAWCHNPESLNVQTELSFEGSKCISCGKCVEVCPGGAASLENPERINREKCETHFSCTEVCPTGALSAVGRKMDPEELARTLLKDRIFFETSGGGVTLSGGEATLYPGYLSKLLQILKAEGIHILLQTSGLFSFPRFEELIYPYLDQIYFDIKIIDPAEHKKYCGVENDVILENFRRLYKKFQAGEAPLLPRTPLIPGITATESNLRSILSLYQEVGVEEAELLSYNPLWPNKREKMGFSFGAPGALQSEGELETWMSPEKEKVCRDIFREAAVRLIGD